MPDIPGLRIASTWRAKTTDSCVTCGVVDSRCSAPASEKPYITFHNVGGIGVQELTSRRVEQKTLLSQLLDVFWFDRLLGENIAAIPDLIWLLAPNLF